MLPSSAQIMSNATPYNVFHIVAGLVGIGILLLRKRILVSAFNLFFGLVDLYQALAGIMGIFPADLFALRPADHVVHIAVGLPLATLGALGLRFR